ncbi:RluA family pseudouridine synthase [Sphaerochaeta halotolerans]|jgi:23S rRNA pseudouridine1911/1915/1917 synthase|uniref:RNA pseudouridine synthase n=1 Tax=Sphaerochaeta halotolerans TaxID=2293840 RepID=A0A372MK35_9SPIR|nr:RNA pseudouridine synthase [Sphaerochaeta halotolerans]MBG0767926.1 RNA pseudouridine synthase [Spirochaetaceae bacterium]MDN5333724.1 rRNA synthase [Sphaerochaeta sp.]MXI86903.1 RNA pseudouridine synthase [Sphaerochaeta halotolerans]RFU96129.1 RNA pseudouridine synthase [Sphaerochaeta halotolerans]
MEQLEGRILYEDNHLIVVNKRGGELVQGDKTGDRTLADLVKEYLKVTYNKKGNVYLGIPHRLDRPTSGLVIFAKTEKALVRMNELFKGNTVKKTYWAIVDKVPNETEGTLLHYIIRDTKANKSVALPVEKQKGKLAKLDYRLIAASKTYYLLEVQLHTGRHHQIRAQFAAIGLHIKGDLKYGFPRSNPDGGICLHARSISFVHPVRKEELTIVADPPQDTLWDAFLSQL